jgi:iron(III) transport system ATP-binding protein
MPDIVLTGIAKRFKGSTEAVSDLDLTINDGAFVCLLGPSGCGKTTTLRMIAGLERPTRGEIRIGERIISSDQTGDFVPPEKRGMGLVFQSYALWPHLSVYDNIAFGLKMQRWPKDKAETKVNELLELLRIADTAQRYPSELSGGQQQRVALARMLAISPDVLLLDEPLSNLDASLRLEMRAELKRLHQELNNTVVFVTHDQLEAMTMATDIAVMNQGNLQQMGPPMDVYHRPQTRFVAEFVGGPPMNLFDRGTPEHKSVADSLVDAVARGGRLGGSDTATVQTAGFRPESVHILTHPTSGSVDAWDHDAVIETTLPTGALWIIGVRVNGVSLFCQMASDPALDPDTHVRVRADLDDIHLFREDGSRVQAELPDTGSRTQAVKP